jgi:hypothetical protein
MNLRVRPAMSIPHEMTLLGARTEACMATRSTRRTTFLVRRINEALAARESAPERTMEAEPPARATVLAPTTGTATTTTAPKQRGRFATMTIEELQTVYLDVVQRPSDSSDRRYLIWKIREAEKGRVNVGPRKTRVRDGEPLDVKILPLRLEADVADKMDEAWRAKGIKSRMEFFRGAIGHYLAHLGVRDAAALFTSASPTSA